MPMAVPLPSILLCGHESMKAIFTALFSNPMDRLARWTRAVRNDLTEDVHRRPDSTSVLIDLAEGAFRRCLQVEGSFGDDDATEVGQARLRAHDLVDMGGERHLSMACRRIMEGPFLRSLVRPYAASLAPGVRVQGRVRAPVAQSVEGRKASRRAFGT